MTPTLILRFIELACELINHPTLIVRSLHTRSNPGNIVHLSDESRYIYETEQKSDAIIVYLICLSLSP